MLQEISSQEWRGCRKGEKGQVEMKNIHAPLVIAATAFLFASGCVKRPSKVLCRTMRWRRFVADLEIAEGYVCADADSVIVTQDRLVEYVIEKHGVSRRNLIRPWLGGTVGM